MLTIWKYPLRIVDLQEAGMPAGAQPLHVGLDPAGVPCLWVRVDPARPIRPLKVAILGTGAPWPDWLDASAVHLGSFVEGPYVWHVYAA